MAEEEKDDKTEETPTEEPTPAAEETAPAEEASAEVAEEAPAEEAAPAAEEAPAEEEAAPAEEAPAEEAAPAAKAAPAEPAEPADTLSSKEARKRSRSVHVEERPARDADQRRSDRQAARAKTAATRRAYRVKSREKARARRAEQPAAETPPPVERPHGRAKVRQGIVVSDRADKTITVRVDSAKRHRRYDKVIRSSSTLHAHDERNDAGIGDTVRVIESRPLSRTKRWRLVEILERAK
jgi:small subunit ribosomal protein S17